MNKTKLQNEKSPFKQLMLYIWQSPLQVVFIIIFALIGNILVLLGPKLIGQAIDILTENRGLITQSLIRLLLILLTIYFVSAFFQWLLGWLSAQVSSRVIHDLRYDVYEHINILPLSFFDSTSFGSVVSRISTDMDQVNDGLVSGLPQLFSGVVSLFASLYFMFSISWKVALLIVGLTPIIFFVSRTISRSSFDKYSLEAKQRADLNGLAEEVIDQHALTRTLQAGKEFSQQYEKMNAELYESGQKAQYYSSLTNPSTRLINAISFILCGFLATNLALKGELTVGQVGSLLFYANQFAKPINQITEIITQIQSALASADKIFDIFEVETVSVEPDDMPELEVDAGLIEFKNVEFSYVESQPLIENLNASIPARSKVAIVGPTGAGKTTLVNLLMRFYELDSGSIEIDKQNIAKVTRDSLRASFGMVLQDVWLFHGTILENLTFANPHTDKAEVEAVCKQVEADRFIKRLKHGYQTIIGKNSSLSQGQKQLLTVARVMLQDPPMLILDEATSDIDTATELRVQKSFASMMKGRTSFVIAHRLSTVLDADMILVMKDGNILEQGNFISLMKDGTLFKKLYESQFEGQAV